MELARDENFNPLSLITEHYPQLRRYGPALLETFEFRSAPVAQDLINAVEVIRQMNRDGLRNVPSNAPLGFIRKRWEEYIFGPEGIDRRFYEVCVMAELKNALRSGDVSVAESLHNLCQTPSGQLWDIRQLNKTFVRLITVAAFIFQRSTLYGYLLLCQE